MVAIVRSLLGITDNEQDELLSVLIDLAKDEATTYCNLDKYTEALDTAVIQMVVQNYNRRGNEGFSSMGFSGVSQSINDNYTNNVIRLLQKHRKLVAV